AWTLDIPKALISNGAELLISINASPFNADKNTERYKVSNNITDSFEVPYLYVNLVGGQDELVFDGGSFALNAKSEYMLSPKFFEESIYTIDINSDITQVYKEECLESNIYNAIVLGLRDYVIKNGFSKCIIGLSGGIDSAIVAAIAVDALGSKNVKGYLLPSRFSSDHSKSDAQDLASRLNIEIDEISIEDMFESAQATLSHLFKGLDYDITEENMQSRIRGLLLMALSNKFGSLLISTGNKSEYAVGYATIYGDMCGAYAPIKDVYKTDVYNLAAWRNKNIPVNSMLKTLDVIPQNSITKEPSAELREGQKDQDTLPGYDTLDQILYQLIELDKMPQELAQDGFDFDLSSKVYNMLIKAEYKRNQSTIGPKVSKRNLDKDRRYPITNGYKIKK
ncbi:MAG: NAD+ synthase, partial [Alphaproteobacteria bacterium]